MQTVVDRRFNRRRHDAARIIDGFGDNSLIIGTIASYLGFTTTQGTEGVGQASTRAVVISSILIIMTNVVLVKLIFFLYPANV